MERKVGKDGKVQVNGSKSMKESGLYPPRLGEAIVQAWAGLQAMGLPPDGSHPSQASRRVGVKRKRPSQPNDPEAYDPWA